MSLRRLVASALIAALACATSPALIRAQTSNVGVISGTAVHQASKPYTNYLVELRDPRTGQIVATTTLDPQALFSFSNLVLDKHYIVELWFVKDNTTKIVCAEGPYRLTTSLTTRSDVDINCGADPALWLLPAAAAAVVIGVATRSTK